MTTLAASGITTTAATLNGSVNPGGASVRTHFDFGATTTYGVSTSDQRLGTATVAMSVDAMASGLSEGATVHFRTVAQTDFATVNGGDQSFTLVNVPPVVSITQLSAKVKLHRLGRGRMLSVGLDVSEPATVTIAVVNKRGKVVRQATVTQASAGSFTAKVSLKRLKPGRYTLRVTATDADGASSTVEQVLRVAG